MEKLEQTLKTIIDSIFKNKRGESMDMKSITVKRPVRIKTVVTDRFKQQVQEELNKEIHLLDSQIMQLEVQSKQIHDQASEFSSLYIDHNTEQIQQALEDVARKLQQMGELKHELVSQRDNISHLALNNVIITGSLENYVELRQGENIYEKFKEAEILVKDGIIQEISD
jgi:hypothetical protein